MLLEILIYACFIYRLKLVALWIFTFNPHTFSNSNLVSDRMCVKFGYKLPFIARVMELIKGHESVVAEHDIKMNFDCLNSSF